MRNKISIIIPAFQASKYIIPTVKNIREVFGKQTEIIVVINDSRSEDYLGVRKLLENQKNSLFLNFSERLGKGKAILEGLKIADGNLVGFIDADCPFNLGKIKINLERLKKGKCDCIICSKWKKASFKKVKQGVIRKSLSRIFNYVVRKWLRINFKDTQGGAKFFDKSVLLSLENDFICSGFVFDVELIVKLLQRKKKVEEIFVENHLGSTSTVNIIKESIPILLNVFRLRYKYRLNEKN